jgi:shikimate dehydrogenase
MIQTIHGTTKVLAIIGNPVSHSKSPIMQNAALQACGLDYIYVPFAVSSGFLGDAVLGLKALGVAGFNVTIPHKTKIISFLDELDETAISAGAVNTVHNVSGRLIGYNTDGEGLIRALMTELEFIPLIKNILLLGAGGAARGALAALCRSGAGRVHVYNRTYSKAAELISDMATRYFDTELVALTDSSELDAVMPNIDLVINATSLGMKCDEIPELRLEFLPRFAKVYDMVYNPPVTELLRKSASLGLHGVNGLGMLAAQGELAFTIWTDRTPPTGLMRNILSDICNN